MDWIYTVSFTPNGKYILTASVDALIKLWDVSTGKLIRTYTGHGNEVFQAHVHPDGNRIISSSLDHQIKVWNLQTGSLIQTLSPDHYRGVHSITISKDGKYLLSQSIDCTFRIWSLEDYRLLRAFRDEAYNFIEYSFWSTLSPDNKYIATTQYSVMKIWNFETLQLIKELKNVSVAQARTISFSENSKYLLCIGAGILELWDTASWNLLAVIDSVEAAILTSDNNYLVTISAGTHAPNFYRILNPRIGYLHIKLIEAKNLKSGILSPIDPYAITSFMGNVFQSKKKLRKKPIPNGMKRILQCVNIHYQEI